VAVNKNDGDLVVELPAEFGVGVNINLVPGETAAAGELGEALLHDFTEMATFAGINHDTAGFWHVKRFYLGVGALPTDKYLS
jgi:hypothetical protein